MSAQVRQGRLPAWAGPLMIAGGIHTLAIGALFVRIHPAAPMLADTPAIAIEMAAPAAVLAPVKNVPTPRQIEAPKPPVDEQPEPSEIRLDVPQQPVLPNMQPDVVVPVERKAEPRPDKPALPLPPAPTTTELAAPDLKPDMKNSAMLTGGTATGKATADALWDSRVRARIELTKRYPGAAMRANQQDEVEVFLRMDRNGHLLEARIRRSRGIDLLDTAALDAVRRAEPFPEPPKEVKGDPVLLSVVVRFVKRPR